MPVVEDTLWKNPGNPGMIVVSSHSCVSKDGRLFMAYGAGQEAVRRIPDLEAQCGQEVQKQAEKGLYGFLPVRPFRPEQRIIGFGLFQTRLQWDKPCSPEIIQYSMDKLRQFIEDYPEVKIRMNFPGIGQGGLPVEEVSSLLVPLPTNITICHQGEIARSLPESFTGFKALYIRVEQMLQEGRFNQAVEYLLENGFDIQSATEQVRAVQRLVRERSEKDVERAARWRSSQTTSGRLF